MHDHTGFCLLGFGTFIGFLGLGKYLWEHDKEGVLAFLAWTLLYGGGLIVFGFTR